MSLLGPELVVNGTFDSAGDWTATAGVDISGGECTIPENVSVTSYIEQSISIASGKTYRFSYDVTFSTVSGDMYAVIGGTEQVIGKTVATHTHNIVAGSDNTNLRVRLDGTDIVKQIDFDNVSVKELSTASEIEEAVYDILRLDATVSGLVSGNITPQIISQNTDLPALVYEIVSAPRGHHFTGMTDLVPARFQITAWSETYTNLRATSDAVRGALDSLQETVGSVEITSSLMIDEVDLVETVPGTRKLRRYGRAMDYRITYREI